MGEDDLPATRNPGVKEARVDDGDLLIYDRDNGEAWVQSDYYVRWDPVDDLTGWQGES